MSAAFANEDIGIGIQGERWLGSDRRVESQKEEKGDEKEEEGWKRAK